MKLLYLLFDISYFKFKLLCICLLLFISINITYTQCTNPQPIAPLYPYVSVDPPTFQWYPCCLGWPPGCNSFMVGFFDPEIYPSCAPLLNFVYNIDLGSDSIWTMSNGYWNILGVNHDYLWSTRTFGGPMAYWCVSTVKRLPAALPPTNLILPINGSIDLETTPLMKWGLVDSASSYRATIYFDRGLQTIAFDSIVSKDSIRVPANRLSQNSTFWWRVKAYKTGGEGPYADVFYFKTLNPPIPPAVPVLKDPLNGSNINTYTPTLNWDSITTATGYDLQIASNSAFTQLILDTTGLYISFLNIRNNLLENDITYYWRVKATNSFGSSPWSSAWSFRIPSVPVWNTLNTGTGSYLYSIKFLDTSTGYACGSAATVIKSTDGGMNWTVLPFGGGGWMCDLFFLNKDTGWVVGEAGTVKITTDGGASWTAQYTGFSSWITTVYFIDANTGFLGCTSGGAYRTTNGGSNWSGISITPGYLWQEYCFPPDGGGNIGYVGGENSASGGVIKTTDNGLNWFRVTQPASPSSWGISFINVLTGFTVGANGYIGYTTDGGSNWIPQNSGITGSYLFDVTHAGSSSAWVVGNSGIIINTNDNGVFWQPNISNTSVDLRKVSFVNSNTGWTCGGGGTILKTTNGGATSFEPILISPLNGATAVTATPILDWSFVSGAEKYRLQVSLDQNFITNVIDDSSSINSQFIVAPGILSYYSVFYWRVSAKHTSGWSNFSPAWNFRTFGQPQQTVLYNPPNNAVEMPTNITFTWFKTLQTLMIFKNGPPWTNDNLQKKSVFNQNSNPDAIGKYWFEITTDTISLAGLQRDSAITDSTYTLNNLNTSSKYFWRVKAKNEVNWGPFSSWWSFTTTFGPPQAPVLSSPGNNTAQSSENLLFVWHKAIEISSKHFTFNKSDHSGISHKNINSGDAVGAYWFELTVDTVTMSGLIRDTTITDTTKSLGSLNGTTNYFWRVKAKNQTGWGVFSPWWKFLSTYANSAWQVQIDDGPYFKSISFINSQTGWAAGSGFYSFEVHKTTNGGTNWFQTASYLEDNAISFSDENNGCVTGTNHPDGYYVTLDGGYGWYFQDFMFFYTGFFTCAASINGETWVGGLMETKNPSQGSKTIILRNGYESLRDNDAVNLNRLRFTTPDRFWCVGSNGRVFRYIQGSYTKFILNGNLKGVSFPDTSNGYIVGDSYCYKTTNNGNNWSILHPLSPDGSYSDIKFVNKDTGWIACDFYDKSGILATTNGGLNWSVQWAGVRSWQPYELSFVSPSIGWAVFYRTIIKTGTGGNPPSIPAPVLLLPPNDTTGLSLTPALDWSDVTSVVKYRLQVSQQSNFSNNLIDDSTITLSQYLIPNGILNTGIKYYWRAAASNDTIWSDFSAAWNFSTLGVPQQVILSYPQNNAFTQPADITFSWHEAIETLKKAGKEVKSEKQKRESGKLLKNENSNIDAIGNYWFELTSDTVTFTGLVRDTLLTDTAKTVNNLLIATNYYWRVKAKNEVGWGVFSSWWKFSTYIPAPNLLLPPHGSIVYTTTPFLDWDSVQSVTSYRVQIAADTSFNTLRHDTSIVSSNYTVRNGVLAAGSTNYWRVRGENSSGIIGYWSLTRRFSVGSLPYTPVLTFPPNGSTGQSTTPLLDWDSVTYSNSFKVQVSKNNTFTSIVLDSNGLLISNFRVPAGILTPDSLYYWRVCGVNAVGQGPWSAIWNFTSRGTPLQVVLFYPQNNSTGLPIDITFSWYKAIESMQNISDIFLSGLPVMEIKDNRNILPGEKSDIDAIGNYWFELTADTVTLSGLVRDTLITDTTKVLSGLNVSTTYFWRVKAKGGIGWGPLSSWWKFTTTTGLPEQVILNSPPDNSINQPVNMAFNWFTAGELLLKPTLKKNLSENSRNNIIKNLHNSADAINAYWFELTTDTVTLAGLIRDTVLTDTIKTINGLNNSTTYYWRAKAKNAIGWGSFSVWFKFTTQAALNVNITYTTDWNMISIPVNANPNGVRSVFPTCTPPAFYYNNGYQSDTILVPGRGFWLFFNSGGNQNLTGLPVSPQQIPVTQDWNMIGAFESNIAVNSITSNPPGIINSLFFKYSGGYITADTLKPGVAYWVNVTQNGNLIIPSAIDGISTVFTEKENQIHLNDNWIKIIISDNSGKSSVLYLGKKEEMNNSYKLPPMPPVGIFDVRFGSDSYVEMLGLSKHEINIQTGKYPIKIKAENLKNIKLQIKDNITGKLIDKTMQDNSEIIINEKINSFVLIEEELPKIFSLSQNYPNPFNPLTHIKFGVPVKTFVKLVLYDILGQEISSLVNEVKEPGYYTVDFYADDIASGVYFYRIEAGNFTDVKKLLVVK